MSNGAKVRRSEGKTRREREAATVVIHRNTMLAAALSNLPLRAEGR